MCAKLQSLLMGYDVFASCSGVPCFLLMAELTFGKQ